MLLFSASACAQNNIPEELLPFLQNHFPRQSINKYKGFKLNNGGYEGSIETGNIEYSVILDSNFDLLYRHNVTVGPQIKEFKKEFISKQAALAINRKLLLKGRSLDIGYWLGEYYHSNINGKTIIEICEYESDPYAKRLAIPRYFFDEKGVFICVEKLNIDSIMSAPMEKLEAYQTFTTYYIQNKATGLYMNVNGNSNNDLVIMLPYNKINYTKQQFQIFSPNANEEIKIANVKNNLVLTGLPNTQKIGQYSNDNGDWQLFTIEATDHYTKEYVRIRNTKSMLFLGIETANKNNLINYLIQQSYINNDTQLWKLIPVN